MQTRPGLSPTQWNHAVCAFVVPIVLVLWMAFETNGRPVDTEEVGQRADVSCSGSATTHDDVRGGERTRCQQLKQVFDPRLPLALASAAR